MNIFFLTKREQKVYFSLTEEPSSVTEIAEVSKLPRTTVSVALIKLESLGLLKSKKVREKNKHLFCRLGEEEVDSLIEEVRSSLLKKNVAAKSSLFFGESSLIKVLYNKSAIIEAVNRVISVPSGERIYMMQSQDAAPLWEKWIGLEEILRIHKTVVDGKVILVSLRDEAYFDSINRKEIVRRSFKGRIEDARIVKNILFEPKSSVYVSKDAVLIVDLERFVALEIIDKKVVSIFKKILSFLAQKVDRDPDYLQRASGE